MYNKSLADQIRKVVAKEKDIAERRMFGGLAFLKHGRMAVGILKDRLIIKISKGDFDKFTKQSNIEPMKFTGKVMKGFVVVRPKGYASPASLKEWVRRGLHTATALGPKTAEEKERARKKFMLSTKDELEAIGREFPPLVKKIAIEVQRVIEDEGFRFLKRAYKGWKAIGYRHERFGYICGVFYSPASVKLVFENGAKMADPHKILQGGRERLRQIRYLEFKTLADIQAKEHLVGDLLREAMRVKLEGRR